MIVLVVIGGLVGGGYLWATRSGYLGAKEDTSLITAPVVRGSLEIKVVERGNLESAANVTLQSKVEGTVAIIKIVDEGTRAKKGQLLVELDSSKLRNDYTQQQILVKQAEAAEQQAMEAVEIQRTQNDSDIAAATLKLQLAQLDLDKYKKGEYEQQKKTIDGEITLAQEDKSRAQEAYEFTKRLSRKGYATPSQLEADRISVVKADINLGVAKKKLEVLELFDSKRQLAEKEANALEFVREVERVKRKASAAMTQAQADYDANKLTADVERTKLSRLKTQIEACTIIAPQDGLVVYANERSGGRGGGGSQEAQIQEGAQVRERQAIINLPDVSKMRVNARIHESKIDLIEEDLPARIKVDALPGKIFAGKVDTVSLVPLSGNWPNFNLKEYSTTVAINGGKDAETLKPGLTAEVEILVKRIESCIQMPIQCVVERGGRHFAFPLVGGKAARREVKIGKSNDMMVEVLDGLKEGDRVVQNPRAALPDLMTQLEKDVPAEGPKPTAPDLPATTAPTGKSPGDTPSDSSAKSDEEKAKARAERRKKAEQGGGQGAPGGSFDPAERFKQQDKNSDGKLTEDEVSERMKPNFAKIDANGDKSVDLAEYQKYLEAMRAQWGGGRPGGGTPGAGTPGGGPPSGAPAGGENGPRGGGPRGGGANPPSGG